MRQIIESATLALLVAASSPGNAQVLKQEPLDGKMVPGSVVLVDDGTCGKGKIKQVTGGETDAMNPRPRIRKCISNVRN
jgi:3-phenylpropionate/cinnamic acid dioxygenase small subunit